MVSKVSVFEGVFFFSKWISLLSIHELKIRTLGDYHGNTAYIPLSKTM